jgi:hypothetical protein
MPQQPPREQAEHDTRFLQNTAISEVTSIETPVLTPVPQLQHSPQAAAAGSFGLFSTQSSSSSKTPSLEWHPLSLSEGVSASQQTAESLTPRLISREASKGTIPAVKNGHLGKDMGSNPGFVASNINPRPSTSEELENSPSDRQGELCSSTAGTIPPVPELLTPGILASRSLLLCEVSSFFIILQGKQLILATVEIHYSLCRE